MPTTIQSLEDRQTRLEPNVPAKYLSRFIVESLNRAGAEGAEVGVIAEMERLLERHVQALFTNARDYANLSGRQLPNAQDALAAHARSSHSASKLNKESKKRRKAVHLEIVEEPPEAILQETLLELKDVVLVKTEQGPESGMSTPGALSDADGDEQERRLDYAFEGAPSLPKKWTYVDMHTITTETKIDEPVKVTAASLEFVKSTVAEANVDPELGVVHYRRGQGMNKRKWAAREGVSA